MIINTTGSFRLTKDTQTRNLTTVATLPAGTVIEVTQIDSTYNKFYSPQMLNWHYWDIPAEPATDATLTEKGKDE